VISAGKEKSSDQEDSKEEDSKEEISFPLHVRTFLGPEDQTSGLLLVVFFMKTPFLGERQVRFADVLKNKTFW
jgi:hypothetical protein